jgi:hypothetical protein
VNDRRTKFPDFPQIEANSPGNFMIRSLGKGECSASYHLILKGKMVLQERIELSTSPLPRECSTTELLQHPKRVQTARGFLPQHRGHGKAG